MFLNPALVHARFPFLCFLLFVRSRSLQQLACVSCDQRAVLALCTLFMLIFKERLSFTKLAAIFQRDKGKGGGRTVFTLPLFVSYRVYCLYPQCQGKGMFEVHFLDYSNPGQRDSQTRCCSGQEVQGRCPSPCSTFFSVCLRPQVPSSCLFGQKSTEVLGNSSFVIPSNSLLLVPWHVSLETFQVSYELPFRDHKSQNCEIFT